MNRQELQISRRKHLDQNTRGHFWTDEERRHSPDVQKGEGKRYSTMLNQFLDYLQQIHAELEYPARLETILRNVEEAAFRYVDTRVEFSRAAKLRDKIDAQAYREVREEADKSRRNAHNSLIDSLRIAARNFHTAATEAGIDWQLPEETKDLLGEANEKTRQLIAHAAIDFVWQILDEEEAELAGK